MEVTTVDEHIMAVRLNHTFSFMSLSVLYAPTNVCKLNVKKVFYANLAFVTDSCPWQDICTVLGDFNAVSGCDQAGYKMDLV